MKRSLNPRLIKIAWPLLLLALAVAFPLIFTNPALVNIAVFALIFAGLATSWNIFSGYTGYTALGHTVFFGLSVAYTVVIVSENRFSYS